MSGVPLENWGGMAKLWSVERAVCDAGDLACGGGDGLVCEDLGDAELMAAFPRAMFELVMPPNGAHKNDDAVMATMGPPPAIVPVEAFSDEGPGVAVEAPLLLGAMRGTDVARATTTAGDAPAPSYCSYDEPNACESPVAALTPLSSVDATGYGVAGPSLLE